MYWRLGLGLLCDIFLSQVFKTYDTFRTEESNKLAPHTEHLPCLVIDSLVLLKLQKTFPRFSGAFSIILNEQNNNLSANAQ